MADKLGDGSTPLWLEFERRTASWSAADRKTLLARFLGFPLWDSLIFPTIALSQLPQFTPIGVAQFSPLTARALETPPEGKLRGVTLHHFGAFLDAAWRENDYLWGRLDAAELILRMLRDASPPVDSDVDVDDALEPMSRNEAIRRAGADHLKRALSAIVTAESGLKRVGDLRARLEAEIARLPGSVDRRPRVNGQESATSGQHRPDSEPGAHQID
jgi:hypothetical protein